MKQMNNDELQELEAPTSSLTISFSTQQNKLFNFSFVCYDLAWQTAPGWYWRVEYDGRGN